MEIQIPGGESPLGKNPVFTRLGNPIPQLIEDKNDIELIRIRAKELLNWHPMVQLRSLSPYPYNCMGLIFAARRISISIDHINFVLKEDGYKSVKLSEIIAGDIVVYRFNNELSHVGLIMEVNRTLLMNSRVISKWGRDGEFIHFMNDVPKLYGEPVEYYTDRER